MRLGKRRRFYRTHESAGKEHYGVIFYNWVKKSLFKIAADILYTDIVQTYPVLIWYLLEPKPVKFTIGYSALCAPGYIGSSHPSSDDVAVFYVNISLLGLMWYQFSVINDEKSPAEQESVENVCR